MIVLLSSTIRSRGGVSSSACTYGHEILANLSAIFLTHDVTPAVAPPAQ